MLSEQQQVLFFRVIRLALHGGTLAKGESVPTEVVEALERHAVLGVVADTIAEHVTPEVQQHIYEHMAALVRKECREEVCVTSIVASLQAAGIKAVLLKGLGLSRLYPDNGMRAVGDVDIFVGRERYSEAMSIVGSLCGEPDIDTRIPPTSIHGTADMDGIHIEVHHMAADTALKGIKAEYNDMAERLLLDSERYAVINGKRVCVPPLPFDVVYVFEHLLKHLRYEGVGIRQFVDWIMALKALAAICPYEAERPAAEYVELRDMLRRFRLLDAWQVLGGILVWQLGLPKELFPFWNERKARHSQRRNLRYILQAENLGRGTATAKGYYFMPPSLKRKFLALKYYLPVMIFEHHLFPYEGLKVFF
ncbi:MAG: nucleotidyltransferase family protein [Prevotella sp.]|nr:nucleotidyltransferase family protein [Candidatus Prevotella equi]